LKSGAERLGNYAGGALTGDVFTDPVGRDARFVGEIIGFDRLEECCECRISVVSESDAMDPLSPRIVTIETPGA
jgi:hypothetical protein